MSSKKIIVEHTERSLVEQDLWSLEMIHICCILRSIL